MAKGSRPTIKQRLFVKALVKRQFNGTQAAMDTYDVKKRENAKQIAYQNLAKPAVQEELKRVLEKNGLSLDDVVKGVKEATFSGVGVKATNGDALRGFDMLLKLHSAYPASKSMKLVYSKSEQVVSKDLQKTVEDLKKITERASSLIATTD